MLPWKDEGRSREEWFASLISCRMKDPSKNRIVEFGSATGAITKQLLGWGFKVTAIEARAHCHRTARSCAPEATQVLGDLEVMRPVDAGGPFEAVVHVGVLYHMLGPIEHLMQLRLWAPRVLLDTHYCEGDQPELHHENVAGDRAGLRPGSWWLPKHTIEQWLRASYTKLERINDRQERNGPRATWWAEA